MNNNAHLAREQISATHSPWTLLPFCLSLASHNTMTANYNLRDFSLAALYLQARAFVVCVF